MLKLGFKFSSYTRSKKAFLIIVMIKPVHKITCRKLKVSLLPYVLFRRESIPLGICNLFEKTIHEKTKTLRTETLFCIKNILCTEGFRHLMSFVLLIFRWHK